MSESPCRSTARLLGAYADGQLDAASTFEVDDHLAGCEVCNERLLVDRAVRGSLQRTTKQTAPDDVRARMMAALAAETSREVNGLAVAEGAPAIAEAAEASPPRGMLRRWRTALPLASAAAITLAWGLASQQPITLGAAGVAQGSFGNDELIRDLVDVHKRPIRPETPDLTAVRSFEPDVGVPVRAVHFKKNEAKFVGARIVNMHGAERAAMLQYELAQRNGGRPQRVSVFVYDPSRVHIRSATGPRMFGQGSDVRVVQQDGCSVAVREHGGVAYAYATDLDPDSSLQLIASAEPE